LRAPLSTTRRVLAPESLAPPEVVPHRAAHALPLLLAPLLCRCCFTAAARRAARAAGARTAALLLDELLTLRSSCRYTAARRAARPPELVPLLPLDPEHCRILR